MTLNSAELNGLKLTCSTFFVANFKIIFYRPKEVNNDTNKILSHAHSEPIKPFCSRQHSSAILKLSQLKEGFTFLWDLFEDTILMK